MKLTFLGTAGLVPGGLGLKVTGSRGMLCMVVDEDTIIEVGDGALRNLNAAKTDLNAIERILISHLHSDHFIGIVHVLFDMMNVGNRKKPLEIIGPKGIAKATQGLMDLCELPVADAQKRGYEIRYRELGAFEAFEDVRTARGEHPSEAHAYRIERNGRVLFYNGESSFTPEVLKLAQGADLFISTVVVLQPHSFHIAPEDLGRAATATGAKRVAVIHWPTEFEGRREQFAQLVQKHFQGEVVVPDDFTTVVV